MSKNKEVFLEQFAKLGVYNKVQNIALLGDAPKAGESCSSRDADRADEADGSEEVKDLLAGKAYHWRDWSIVRSKDCLYLWSDVAAIELSNGSNGWFRFILDGKLATMYSSGSPEGTTDSSENRGRVSGKAAASAWSGRGRHREPGHPLLCDSDATRDRQLVHLMPQRRRTGHQQLGWRTAGHSAARGPERVHFRVK